MSKDIKYEIKKEIEVYLEKVQERQKEGVIKPNYNKTVKTAMNSFIRYLETGQLPGDTKL